MNPVRRAAALLLVLVTFLLAGEPALAADAVRKPVVKLSVSPGHLASRGTVVSMAASVRPAGSPGVVRFYDGTVLLASKARRNTALVLFTTRSLKTGTHRLRVVYGRGTPFRPLARSRVWVLVVTPAPTIDDQNLVATVPKHKPVKVGPGRHERPPRVTPPVAVGGAGQGRGGLAFTGVALLGLLLLALTLVVTGSAAWFASRRRARGAVRLVGGVLTVVGGVGAGAVYLGGPSAGPATAAPAPRAPDYDSALPATWPADRPVPQLSVLSAAGTQLAEPIVVRPGVSLTVVASGFGADDAILARPDDAGPATAPLQADSSGTVRFRVVIPPGVAPGVHTVSLTGSQLTAGVAFTVRAARGVSRSGR